MSHLNPASLAQSAVDAARRARYAAGVTPAETALAEAIEYLGLAVGGIALELAEGRDAAP